MDRRPKPHTLLIREEVYVLLDEEARKQEAETGGRVSRARIAEKRIRAAYGLNGKPETTPA